MFGLLLRSHCPCLWRFEHQGQVVSHRDPERGSDRVTGSAKGVELVCALAAPAAALCLETESRPTKRALEPPPVLMTGPIADSLEWPCPLVLYFHAVPSERRPARAWFCRIHDDPQ